MSKPKKRRSKRTYLVTQIIAALFLIAGAVVALYPFYVGGLNDILDNYRSALVQKDNAARAKDQLRAMEKKNKELEKRGLNANADPFSGKTAKEKVDLKKTLIGDVTVPKLKLTVPLFKTLTEATLEIGAAVVDGTSMPTGGPNTHTVIAGHRGLVNRRLFSDLNRVHKGDIFVLKVFGKHLAYKVNKIQVVLPNNTQVLKLEPGKDLATLMTCTPYMINSHRLLITGHRVPYTKAVAKQVADSTRGERLQQLAIVAGAFAGLALIVWLLGRWIHILLLRRRTYDLTFQRQDAAGNPLPGVRFGLCKPNGKPLYRKGTKLEVSADTNGLVTIENIPGGRYRLKELKDGKATWSIRVGTKKLRQQETAFYPKKRQRATVVKGDDGLWIVKR